MARDDDKQGEGDPDRAAILARRQRFVALALGGLASGCTPGKPDTKPDDSIESASEAEGESGTTGEESGSSDETGPAPCLKYDLPPDPGTDDESGSEDTGETGTPRPCLVPTG